MNIATMPKTLLDLRKYNNKFSMDTLISLMSRFIEIICGFSINLLIARKYGNDGLGVFNQALAVYMIFTVVINLGLANSIIKHCSEVVKDTKIILQDHFKITFSISYPLIALLIFAIYLFPNLFSNHDVANATLIVLFSLPIFLVNKNFFSYYNAIRSIKALSVLRAARWLLIILTMLVISLFNNNISQIMFSFLIAELLLLVANIFYFKTYKIFFSRESINKKYLLFGGQTFLAEILATIGDKISIIILGYLLSKNDIGIYSLLITIVSTLYYFQTVVAQNVNPVVSRLYYEKKLSELQSKVRKIMQTSTIVSIVISVFMIPAFLVLQKFFLAKQLEGAFPLFFLLLVAMTLLSPFYWTGGMLIMGSYVKENFYRTLFLVIVNIVTLLILSYYYSIWGAAYALLVYNLITVIVQYQSVNKLMNIRLSF